MTRCTQTLVRGREGRSLSSGGSRASSTLRVAVCGAGIAGLAFAHVAASQGCEVVVVEKAPGPRRQGYMMDFWGPGYDTVQALGLLGRLQELDHEIAGVRFLGETGRCRADGNSLDADLVVGAGGVHSAVRALTFGEEGRFVRRLGFRVAAFSFTDPAISAAVRDWYHFTDTIDTGFCLYGLADDEVGVFAVRRSAQTSRPADVAAALRVAYGRLGWLVPDALAHLPPEAEIYEDVVAQSRMPTWSRGRSCSSATPATPCRCSAARERSWP